jgi:hypothetical protein
MYLVGRPSGWCRRLDVFFESGARCRRGARRCGRSARRRNSTHRGSRGRFRGSDGRRGSRSRSGWRSDRWGFGARWGSGDRRRSSDRWGIDDERGDCGVRWRRGDRCVSRGAARCTHQRQHHNDRYDCCYGRHHHSANRYMPFQPVVVAPSHSAEVTPSPSRLIVLGGSPKFIGEPGHPGRHARTRCQEDRV